MGNNWADQLATSPQALTLQEATKLHNLTHIDWRGLQHRFPQIPMKDLKRIVHTCKTRQPVLKVPPLQAQRVNSGVDLKPNTL